MIQNAFGVVIEELGKVWQLQLTPDQNNSCKIDYQDGLTLQMDHDEGLEAIIILANLGVATPGRYRELLFKEALKANGVPEKRAGIFAFGHKNESLVLFDTISMKDLNGDRLAEFIDPLITRAQIWHMAMGRGEIPSFSGAPETSREGTGMFGM